MQSSSQSTNKLFQNKSDMIFLCCFYLSSKAKTLSKIKAEWLSILKANLKLKNLKCRTFKIRGSSLPNLFGSLKILNDCENSYSCRLMICAYYKCHASVRSLNNNNERPILIYSHAFLNSNQMIKMFGVYWKYMSPFPKKLGLEKLNLNYKYVYRKKLSYSKFVSLRIIYHCKKRRAGNLHIFF